MWLVRYVIYYRGKEGKRDALFFPMKIFPMKFFPTKRFPIENPILKIPVSKIKKEQKSWK